MLFRNTVLMYSLPCNIQHVTLFCKAYFPTLKKVVLKRCRKSRFKTIVHFAGTAHTIFIRESSTEQESQSIFYKRFLVHYPSTLLCEQYTSRKTTCGQLIVVSDAIRIILSLALRNGYKMCIRAYLNGDGSGYKTHLSLFFVVMKGEYDALLKWPFDCKVSMILVGKDMFCTI